METELFDFFLASHQTKHCQSNKNEISLSFLFIFSLSLKRKMPYNFSSNRPKPRYLAVMCLPAHKTHYLQPLDSRAATALAASGRSHRGHLYALRHRSLQKEGINVLLISTKTIWQLH